MKFIKLTLLSGREIYLDIMGIDAFFSKGKFTNPSYTKIYIQNDIFKVKESPEEILKLIKEND